MKAAGKTCINRKENMRVFVDDSQEKGEKQFAYKCEDGGDEWVGREYAGSRTAIISLQGFDEVEVFINDIPKLIKALQAAHKEWGSNV